MTIEPVMEPGTVGAKLTAAAHEAPAARVAGLELDVTCGQVELLLKVNPVEMFGLNPEPGTSKVNGALPSLVSVTVLGLSELVEPTAVLANVKLGGLLKFSCFARPLR